MRALLVLLVLFVAHTSSLWDVEHYLAGDLGDPMAHAAIPATYCDTILTGKLETDRYLAPFGVNLRNSFDSPFPLILTCPFYGLGSQAMFHLFTALQVLLIVLAGWLLGRVIFPGRELWQIAFTLFVWFTGYYIARVYQHITLLSGIWGFLLLLWMMLTIEWERRGRVVAYGVLLGLIFAGTFQNIPMLGVPVVILVGHQLWKRRPPWLNVALAFGAFVATFTALFWPSLYGYFSQDLPRAVSDRAQYNLDLASFFLPFSTHYFYQWLEFQPVLTFERYNTFSLVCLALALWGMRRREFFSLPLAKPVLAIAAFSWISSLGPEFRWMNEVLGENPLDELWVKFTLSGISRTPARFAVITNLSLIYLAFAQYRDSRSRWLGPALLVAAVIAGPALNRAWRLPTMEIAKIFPLKALEEISRSPEDSIVVNIPQALASDPSQNFAQLKHGRRITAGYLAYTAHTEDNVGPIRGEPLLNQLACQGETFAFRGDGPAADANALREHMLKNKYRFIIVNKIIMGNDPRCGTLMEWVRKVAKLPWVKALEENNYFAVLAIQ